MQKFNGNTRIIVGVDHGYGNMKTAHRVFRTGVECMEEEPIVSKNFVRYKDKFYVIGESHLVYQGNKTDSEDFYILTLAALAEELKRMNMMADIGNGTMNVMQIVDNKPMEKSLVTDKFGVGICMKEIQKELSKENGEDIPEMLIEPLLWNGLQGRTDHTAKKVAYIAKKYTENIRKRLTDYGYKEGLVHLYVIGGGGCLLRNYSDLTEKAGVTFITDICANAKGYETLAEKKSRR